MSAITQILELKGTQEFLLIPASNPKMAVEGGGTYKDYDYLIVLSELGHRCGYVGLKDKDIIGTEDDNYDDYDIDCHGGLTFASKHFYINSIIPNPTDNVWIGFDGMHGGDQCDFDKTEYCFKDHSCNVAKEYLKIAKESAQKYPGILKIRDYDFMEKECKHIIDQLIGVEV